MYNPACNVDMTKEIRFKSFDRPAGAGQCCSNCSNCIHTHTHKLNVDLRRRWNETSPIVFSRLAGTTTLLSGICAGWPVPAACHLSISTNDHHIRTHSSSSESGSVVESTGEHFHSFIELARATARARRKGRLEVPRQSASMIKISSVCA